MRLVRTLIFEGAPLLAQPHFASIQAVLSDVPLRLCLERDFASCRMLAFVVTSVATWNDPSVADSIDDNETNNTDYY